MNTQLNGIPGFDSGQQITGEHLTLHHESTQIIKVNSLVTKLISNALDRYLESTEVSTGQTTVEAHVKGNVGAILRLQHDIGKISADEYKLAIDMIPNSLITCKGSSIEM